MLYFILRGDTYTVAQEWNLDFYEDQRGRVPVSEFLDELDDRVVAKVTQDLKLLRKHGLDG
jgi:hypothetical protein